MQGLQGVHIIEGMIQLLTDSLVFQLLSVQFVCRSKGKERADGAGSEGNAEQCRPRRGKKEIRSKIKNKKVKNDKGLNKANSVAQCRIEKEG